MLDLEVVPERSLGNGRWEFVLGMPIQQAVSILKRECRFVRSAHLLYSDSTPLSVDVVMDLVDDGVRLVFDPVVQRLKIIEVYDLDKVKLRYCGVHFSVPPPTTPSVSPTIERIDASFGATHPGVFNAEKRLFVLNFRGLSFTFPIEAEFEPRYARGFDHRSRGLGSLPFPSGASPRVTKMCVYAGSKFADTRAPTLPTSCMHGNAFLETLRVVREGMRTKGVQLVLVTDEPGPGKLSEVRRRTFQRSVHFGDTAEAVLSALGCPSREFFKSEDKMRIHSPGALLRSRDASSFGSDYFLNYFTLGLDVLIDASTHRVKKFVLHTNFPGHYDFNIYHRCAFSLPLRRRSSRSSSATRPGPTGLDVTPYTKWNLVQDFLGPSSAATRRPVILNRASTTNTTNPFGPTFCYGVEDVVFEIMSNDYIASVVLYEKAGGNVGSL